MTVDDSRPAPPASFVALFIEHGRSRPSATYAHIMERHEFCEDLAQLLSQRAAELRGDLGITRDDVLERMRRGLQAPAGDLGEAEARWVFTRLVELLGWSA